MPVPIIIRTTVKNTNISGKIKEVLA